MSKRIDEARLPPLFFLMLILLISLIPYYSYAGPPPAKIKSNNLEYLNGIYTATGDVVITQEDKRLTASSVTLNNNTGDVTANGNVEFTDGMNTLSSERLFLNLNSDYAKIDRGKIFIKGDNFHLEGNSIERLAEDRFKIKSADFTTCEGESPCWRFKGQNVNIHLNHMLTAQGVSFSVKDIPILYFPYIALPILQDRQTGLLIPGIGYNTSEGLKLNNAFFWAISKSQDATLYADYYGEKGWGSGLEYRYILSKDSTGKLFGYYIRDNQVGKDKWDLNFNHKQLLAEDVSGMLRINYINDKSLFKDISENIGDRLQRTQDSDMYINGSRGNVSAHLWAQYTQNLSGKSNGIFQRLPEAGLKVMDNRISKTPLYWGLTSSASRWEESDTGLTRLQFAPKIYARLLEGTGLIFIPEAGTEHAFYIIDGNNESIYSNQYNLAATITTKLYRPYYSTSGSIEHFIEPAIRYENSEVASKGIPPLLDQNPQLPSDKNIISISLLNRIVSADSNGKLERIYLKLTQLYRITAADPSSMLSTGGKGFSDLRLEALIRPDKRLTLETDTIYSYEMNEIKSTGNDLGFRDDNYSLTIGQRYSKYPKLNFLNASAGLKLKDTDISIDVWYDDKDHLIRESNYSMKYNSQCWAVTFSYKYRPEEKQFSILLALKGVGSVGK
ncbi:MAG: LPS assembly protein LptD [Nitrospira sp.]|nr:LPS assembly protein LptD [Nitrospira sp.]